MSVKYSGDSHGVRGGKHTTECLIVLGSRPRPAASSSRRVHLSAVTRWKSSSLTTPYPPHELQPSAKRAAIASIPGAVGAGRA